MSDEEDVISIAKHYAVMTLLPQDEGKISGDVILLAKDYLRLMKALENKKELSHE